MLPGTRLREALAMLTPPQPSGPSWRTEARTTAGNGATARTPLTGGESGRFPRGEIVCRQWAVGVLFNG
jgi:hypothetical protein